VTLKVSGVREVPIRLFARSVLDRRRAVVAAARSLAVAFAIVLLAGEAAWADCTPAAVNNVTATCTGTTTNQGGGAPGSSAGTDGYGTGVETGITVNAIGGSLSGTNTGVFLGDGTVTNNASATITGGIYGIAAATGFANVTNSGSITGTAGYGIYALTSAMVTNNAGGSLIGGGAGILVQSGFADVTNSGTITGIAAFTNATVTNNATGSITGTAGIGAVTGFANVVNSGSITGTALVGIAAGTDATVTNNVTGSITGVMAGILATGTANVTNSGTITGTGNAGIVAQTNVTVTNNATGSITGGGYGILAAVGSVNVTNSGSITGTLGVSAGTNATVTNNAGASITGGVAGIAAGGGSTVFNAGTIIGGGGAAILFAGTGNTLTLAQGSVISGNVFGTGGNTFQLGGTGAAIFDVSTLGFLYQGFGTFNKIDSSIWTLTGTPGQSTIWSINGGTLSVSSDANLGSGAEAVSFNGGILQVTGTTFTSTPRAINWGASGGGFDIADPANTFTVSQNLTGTGGLAKLGAGTLRLTGGNDYSGTTNVAAGTLTADFFSLSANSAHVIAAGATLDLADTIQNIGSLSGAGTVTNSGGGAARLITGTDNTNATFSGVIKDGLVGTTTLWIDGSGITTLTGTNSYTGGTSICLCSTLQLGNGGATGSIVGDVTNGGTLIFNHSNAYTFAGVISDDFTDPGKVVQNGSGNTILTGINTYTGATTVNDGTLSVNGSIASSSLTTVNAGGTLGGNGIVGSTTINGGTLSPGNSIGPLTVQGSLTLTAAATYLVQVSGTSSDKTVVTGTANLAGTVKVDPLARLAQKTSYTILTSSGLNGTTFSSVNLLVANNFVRNPQLSYVGNNVVLTLDPGLLSPILPANAGANHIKVAGAIDNALLGGSSLSNAFSATFNLSANNLLNGLNQLSGETATGSQQTTFQAMTQFLSILLDPLIDGRVATSTPTEATPYADEDALAYASKGKRSSSDAYAAIYRKAPLAQVYDPRWSVWAAGFGGSQTTDGNAALGSNNTTSRVFGMAAGADYLLSPRTIAGFALAGGGTSFSVANGGSGRSDLFQAGAFIKHKVGAAYFSGALAYGWQDITTDRTVTIAGVDQLRAKFNANAFSGRVEGGYRFVTPWMGVTPYAAGQFTTFDLPAYAEQALSGANTFALNYASKSVTATRSELGVRTDKSWAMPDGIFTLRSRFAWAHDFNTDRNIAATFQTLPGASFVVNGAAQAHDAALTTASAEMKWLNGFSLAATFEGEFSDVTRSYAGKGAVRYAW
jgi:autotransporter-associated beta strand protein